MTENGAVTLIRPEDDDERAFNTDGFPLPGVELEVAGADGTTLPVGQAGNLFVRTCSNFGGYLHRPHLNGTDEDDRSEEHTSELQSLMRISYAVFCLKKKKKK